MILAGHQPNYIPWLGFFNKLSNCDVFVVEDNVQFVYHEFQNRNKIKTANGIKWLTIPVLEGRKRKKIFEMEISNEKNWTRKHWLTIYYSYSKASHWEDYCDFFETTFKKKWTKLVDINLHMIREITNFLDIDKELILASSLDATGQDNELIISQCKELGANTYLSGIGGHNYIDLEMFQREGIKVIFQKFDYPIYNQLFGDYVPNLSVIDYLFCTGGKVR